MPFDGDLGYSLGHAKTLCASTCDNREDCFFADLLWTSDLQQCYLIGNDCGDWESNAHGDYYLYQKPSYGIINDLEWSDFDIDITGQ